MLRLHASVISRSHPFRSLRRRGNWTAFFSLSSGKVGFENFKVTGQSAPAGFVSAVGLATGATYFAIYPGGGIEAFAGPIGVRAEIGDNIFFNNGGHNNVRISFGPQFRF